MRSFRMSPEVFLKLFEAGREHHFRVLKGLPSDAKLESITFDADRDGLIDVVFDREVESPVLAGVRRREWAN